MTQTVDEVDERSMTLRGDRHLRRVGSSHGDRRLSLTSSLLDLLKQLIMGIVAVSPSDTWPLFSSRMNDGRFSPVLRP